MRKKGTWRLTDNLSGLPRIEWFETGQPDRAKVAFCTLHQSGFGMSSTQRTMAEKVVKFLNSLPARESTPYPYNL